MASGQNNDIEVSKWRGVEWSCVGVAEVAGGHATRWPGGQVGSWGSYILDKDAGDMAGLP